MAFIKTRVFILFMVATFKASMADVYTVGDGKGWRITGDNSYNEWASGKKFQVGDVLVFRYDPNEDNVLQVTNNDFESCTSIAALSVFNSGNDNINITRSGTFYYISGVVGHCAAGMKLQITVGQSAANLGLHNLIETPCTPGGRNLAGPFQPGGQNPGPFQLGGQNPRPYPYHKSASSTLSSNWLIANMLGLTAEIVAFESSSLVLHCKDLF